MLFNHYGPLNDLGDLFYGRHGSVNKLERGKEKYTSISKIDIDIFSAFI